MRTALTKDKKARFTWAKKEITLGKQQTHDAYARICNALSVIHSEELWVEEAETFDDWCRDVAGFTRQWVYDHIRAHNEGVSTMVDNSRQARELFGLDPDTVKNTVTLAKITGPTTAASVASARQELEGKPKEEQLEIIRERTHRPPPKKVDHAAGLIGILKDAQTRIEKVISRLDRVEDGAAIERKCTAANERLDQAIELLQPQTLAAA